MISDKIKNLSQVKKIIAKLKREGKKIVFTNGCFDLLHYGHVKYLEDAKRMGDILVVVVNSDSSIRKIKGKGRPIISQDFRLGVMASLESVDLTVVFNEETPINLIKSVKPHVLVKGADWNKSNIVGADFVISRGGRVLTVEMVKDLSTTDIIKRIFQLSWKDLKARK